MKHKATYIVTILLAIAASASAGTPEVPQNATVDSIVQRSDSSRWKIMLGGNVLLGAKSSFTGIGATTSKPLPPLTGQRNREYDDGYNKIDSAGNANGLTWNFGFDDSSQYNQANDTLELSISRSAGNGSASDNLDPQPGFNLVGYYEVGEIAGITLGSQGSAKWGFRTGIGYNRIDTESAGSVLSDVTRTQDSFDTNGVVLPNGPYSGDFSGPGLLIGDSPTRASMTITDGASTDGVRSLDADFYSIVLGAYLELPLNQKLSLLIEGGGLIVIASGDYQYNSSTLISGFPAVNNSGNASETDVLGGLSLGLDLNYQFTSNWGAYLGIHYQYLNPYKINANGSNAKLTFDSAFLTSMGVIYRF